MNRSENRQKARVLYDKGWAMVDIAQELGVTDTSVRKWKTRDRWDRKLEAVPVFVPQSDNVTPSGTNVTNTVTAAIMSPTAEATEDKPMALSIHEDPLDAASRKGIGLDYMLDAARSLIESYCLARERLNVKTGQVKTEFIPIRPDQIDWDDKETGVRYGGDQYPLDLLVVNENSRIAGLRCLESITGVSPKVRNHALLIQQKIQDEAETKRERETGEAKGTVVFNAPSKKTIQEVLDDQDKKRREAIGYSPTDDDSDNSYRPAATVFDATGDDGVSGTSTYGHPG